MLTAVYRPAHLFFGRSTVQRLVALMFWLGILSSSSPGGLAADKFVKLKAAQIRTSFVGMDFTDESHWAIQYIRDGSVKSFSMGIKDTGQWRLDGGVLCADDVSGDRECHEIWCSGPNHQLRRPDASIFLEGVFVKNEPGVEQPMRSTLAMTILSAAMIGSGVARAETITFDDLKVGSTPAGFAVALTGGGIAPNWEVQKAPDGQAGNVVVETSADTTNYRFPLLVYEKITATDLDLSVKFRTVRGSVDQAAGLMWRYRDANSYYIVRANALEDNVVLYKVENGRRIDLPLKGKGKTYGAKAPVPKNVWNVLAVQVRADSFTVSLNGKTLYEVEDKTFLNAGKIGLWTKADSVTMFDDLIITVIK